MAFSWFNLFACDEASKKVKESDWNLPDAWLLSGGFVRKRCQLSLNVPESIPESGLNNVNCSEAFMRAMMHSVVSGATSFSGTSFVRISKDMARAIQQD